MFYVTWDWHIKSPYSSGLIEPLMALINPWRLALLFFISGVALRFAMDKVEMRRFLPKRTLRLFLPIAFGVFLLVVPQAYYELLFKGETPPGFWAFWWQYVDFDMEFSIITPTYNHLWYVVYILIYTVLIAALRPVLNTLSGPIERAFGWAGARLGGWPVLVVPIIVLLGYDSWLGKDFPVTHALVDDWYNHAGSFTVMLFGYLAAKSPGFWRAVDRMRDLALGLAATLGVLLLFMRFGLDRETVRPFVEPIRILYGWSVILALLGLAQRHLNRPLPALTYLTEAVFPYYILHQTLIVCFGAWAIQAGLPFWGELAFVVGGTVLGCVLGYELIIRRVPMLRPLFGLSWRDRIGEILPKRTAMLRAP
jgi:glucan biosynthesis protein C